MNDTANGHIFNTKQMITVHESKNNLYEAEFFPTGDSDSHRKSN